MFAQRFNCGCGGGLGGRGMRHIPLARDRVHLVLSRNSFPATPLRQLPKPESIIAEARILVLQPFHQSGSMVTASRPTRMRALMKDLFRSALSGGCLTSGFSTSTDIMRREKSKESRPASCTSRRGLLVKIELFNIAVSSSSSGQSEMADE